MDFYVTCGIGWKVLRIKEIMWTKSWGEKLMKIYWGMGLSEAWNAWKGNSSFWDQIMKHLKCKTGQFLSLAVGS